jgi:AcrR family transcriptional regulator
MSVLGSDNAVSTRLANRSVGAARDRAEREVEALLVAGRRVLTQRGAAGLTVAEVLEEAGLSTRAFYRHFTSRDELVLAVYESEQQRSVARLVDAVAAAPDARAAVVAWIDEHLALGFDARRAARTRALAAEGARLRVEFPEHVDATLAALLTPLVDAIRRGTDDGMFVTTDPEQAARSVHAVVWELVQQRLAGNGPTVVAAREHAVAFCLRALGAAEPS